MPSPVKKMPRLRGGACRGIIPDGWWSVGPTNLNATHAGLQEPYNVDLFFGTAALARGIRFLRLIITPSAASQVHHNLIITLAAQHKLPAVYYERLFASAGGLISYGPDFVDQFRRAASYVDRILKGEKSGDLSVQAPTKYELVINLKTAKALGLEVPPTLLARADEVIE